MKNQMKEKNKQKTKQDWSSDDFVHYWKHYLPPARISPSDLEFVKKKMLEKIKEKGKIKVLILGSSPEYRNLCGELNVPVALIDFKKYNYEYLTKEVKNLPKETFIEGNWLDIVIDKKFDFIFADNVINVLKKDDIRRLLKNISMMLDKDGFFMPRIYVRDKDEKYTPEKAIKEYREERKGQKIYTGIMRNLYLAAYDFEKERVFLKDVWTKVLELYSKKLISKEELEEFRNFSLENRELQLYIPLKENINRILSEIFDIELIFNGTEAYLKKQVPLYALKLKKAI